MSFKWTFLPRKRVVINLAPADIKKNGAFFDLPIAIGFGIKDAASASSVMEVADGIVAGSVFVDLIGESGNIIEKVGTKTKELSEVLH